MGNSIGGIGKQSWHSIEIEGQDVKPTSNFLRSIHLIENPYTVPSALIDFNDSSGTLRDELSLVDGTQLKIKMGKTEEEAEEEGEIELRVLSTKEMVADDGIRIIRTICTINAPKLLFDTKQFRVRGTSKAAMEKVCGEVDIELDSDISPSDNMLWLSMTQSPRKFLSEIEQHTWIDDKALPRAVFTLDKKLKVRDVNKVLLGKAKYEAATSLDGEEGAVLFYEFKHRSISGTNNGLSNYGEKVFWSNAKGDVEMLEEVSITSESKVNVSTDVRGAIEGARIRYEHPTNDINIHESYQKAKYNWRRQNLAYTELSRGLVRGHGKMDLFEAVDLNSGIVSSKEADRIMEKSSGKWLIIGRTRSIISGSYIEAYLLSRNYSSVEGSSGIGGGANLAQSTVDSASNAAGPLQINSSIKQLSKIEQVVTNQEAKLDSLLDTFKEEASKFAFPELIEKYGAKFDALNAIMQEFNLAKFLLGICETLNFLEKLSLNLVIEWKIPFLESIASRLDRMEDLLGSFTNDINDLIAAGDIPDSYLGGPQINQRCVSNKIDDLVGAVNDLIPDKCLDAQSMGRIHGPSMNLSNLIRQMEENLRNLLCSLGDGTVDGSALKGVVPEEEIAFYAPGLEAS